MRGFLSLDVRIRLNSLTVITIILLPAILIEISNSQDHIESTANSSYLGIIFSGNLTSCREDLLVPLGFSGPGFTLGADYTRMGENNNFDIFMRFGLAFLKNRFSHKAYAASIEIHPAWVKRLSDDVESGEFRVGFGLPMKMNNIFIESWDDSHLYWLTSYSIGPACKWQKKLSSKREFSVYLEIPVISLVSRPPAYRHNKQEALTHLTYHFTEPNKHLSLELPDIYRAFFINLHLRRNMNHALLNVGLEFNYNYCSEPKDIYALNTSIILSYQWRTGL